MTKKYDNVIHIPGRLWESEGGDFFTINDKDYLCIADYHSKFLVIKQVDETQL